MLKITSEEDGEIRQGTIAQFMRKRTQLVGFEFGYWKHSQYAAEFLDNALDAIEFFQWKELAKKDSKINFSLDQDIFLGNLTLVKEEREKALSGPLSNEAKSALMQEIGMEPRELAEPKVQIVEKESEEILNKDQVEVEEEVKKITDDMEELIKPVERVIDLEPMVIIRLSESEPPSFLTSELNQKNIMNYTFEIFDNGSGISKIDLKKFGRYLASSKSTELKQTRGSQGFGAPSAFSDSQNTTGKPIIVVSKIPDNIYATVVEFYTTSKDEKKYVVSPTDIDCAFLHGTYIKLHYLNVKYIRGYADKFIEETAYMNPHVTIKYIDPTGEESVYRRLVSSFPKEPKYAKPHPTSINIGDLQDLLAKSENITLASFLKDSFVRISPKIAKEIIDYASRDLQDKLNVLVFEDGYVTKIQKKEDPIHFLRHEQRVYGKSTKPRDILVIYQVESEDIKNKYWDLISKYNQLNKDYDKINKVLKKFNDIIEKAETQKEAKITEKDIKNSLNEIEEIRAEKEKIKLQLENIFKDGNEGLTELKKLPNRDEFENLINEVNLSKAKPAELTDNQFNSLFFAFKSIKYMGPPTETAIPVGDTVLENTLIKEIGLKISENFDLFDQPIDSFNNTIEILREEKKKALLEEDDTVKEDTFDNISIDPKEILDINAAILANFDINKEKIEIDQYKKTVDNLLNYSEDIPVESYNDVFEYFLENYIKDDDFVAAETRSPTSGKGLAYVVEAALAYSTNLEVPKRSRDVLSRFVNRTPKLRDSADCAITKAVQSVNWKNYKLEVYENNLPKGPIKLLVNVSGPFVHLMFKSQSKNALADDENLIKEIKYCLEAIGRRLRVFLNRKQAFHKSQKRASVIEKYIPKFVESVYNIALKGKSKYKEKINKQELQDLMKKAILKKISPAIVEIPQAATIQAEPIQIPGQVAEIEKDIAKPIIEKVLSLKKEAVEKEEFKKELIKQKETKKEIKFPEEKLVVDKIKPRIEKISVQDYENMTLNQLVEYCKKNNIKVPSKATKSVLIEILRKEHGKQKFEKMPKPEKVEEILVHEKVPSPKPVKPTLAKAESIKKVVKPMPVKTELKIKAPTPIPQFKKQTQLPVVTTDRILEVLTDEWLTIKHLIFKLKIKDMLDARFLQLKLKELERKEKVLVDIKMGKKSWKLK